MAVLVYDQPERYSLAYNDNPFVFRSTDYDPTQRFRVTVIDSGGTAIASERIFPRQGITSNGVVTEDRTYYDPSRILQSQVAPTIAIPSANHAGYVNAPSMKFDYALSILEEIQNADGEYESGNVWISNLKTAWNGVRNTRDWLNFDYTDYDMINGASSPKFLTDAPTTQYINSDQSAFLYLLSSGLDVVTLSLVSYDSSGGLVQAASVNISLAENFAYVPVGTYDIENSDSSNWTLGSPATFLNGAAYYTVSVSTTTASKVFTFKINQRCSKYEPIRLHWLNRLGGFDSFNFSLKSSEETEIDRRSYHQQHHRFTGTRWKYDQASRGQTDYHVGTQTKLTVNTPYLTEEESIWMNDFATSPVVYQEVNNELVAMSGKPKMIRKQTSLNDKLMQYTFELDYSLSDMRQRG